MNYDLAMMALEGLARSPLRVHVDTGAVTIEGDAASFKELARLCLLLGGMSTSDESFELQPKLHVSATSPLLRLRVK
jgi:hypothetical protein